MLENIKTSIGQLREEDLSVENILAVCNNLVLEAKNKDIKVEDIRELRKQLNLIIRFVNETYNNNQDQLSQIPLSHLLEGKKKELDQVIHELETSQKLVDEIDDINQRLDKEKNELEKKKQKYIQLTKEKERLEDTIYQYKNIDV